MSDDSEYVKHFITDCIPEHLIIVCNVIISDYSRDNIIAEGKNELFKTEQTKMLSELERY